MSKWTDEERVDALIDVIWNKPEDEPVRILVIDDLRVFKFEVTRYARTPQDAMIAIRDEGPWDAVFWDHDLGSTPDETLTVYPALMMVLEAAFYGEPFQLGKCFIHTDNPVGRETLNQLHKHYDVLHIDAGPFLESILPH